MIHGIAHMLVIIVLKKLSSYDEILQRYDTYKKMVFFDKKQAKNPVFHKSDCNYLDLYWFSANFGT